MVSRLIRGAAVAGMISVGVVLGGAATAQAATPTSAVAHHPTWGGDGDGGWQNHNDYRWHRWHHWHHQGWHQWGNDWDDC